MKDAEVAKFLAAYGTAWSAFDPDAIGAHYALPQIVVRDGSTTFLETDAEILADIDALTELYREHGVARIVLEIEKIEPLPDHAARAVVRWHLKDASGAELLAYPLAYTIVEDDDGVLAIVAVDADGQADAHRAAGWTA